MPALVSSLCNHDLHEYFRMSYALVSKCTGKYYLFQLINTFKDLCQNIQVATILNQILIAILYIKLKIPFDKKNSCQCDSEKLIDFIYLCLHLGNHWASLKKLSLPVKIKG